MPELEATLLARGLLSARSSVPTTLTVDRASSGSKLAGSENKRLIEQIEAYRAELAELRRQLQRQEVVQSLLAESGRLPW
jgi:K+-transporting ATPase c subunit